MDKPRVAHPAVQVWDLPLRIWHWSVTGAVVTALLTQNDTGGLHRISGYAVLGLLAFRICWGFYGSRYSRFSRIRFKLRAMPGYMVQLKSGRAGRYLGLNPAGSAMMVTLLLLLAISAVTGAMQVTVRFFGVWWVEDTHAYASHAILFLLPVHVLGVIAVSLMQRENLIRSMLTGQKRR